MLEDAIGRPLRLDVVRNGALVGIDVVPLELA
jgi:hypothetical protein